MSTVAGLVSVEEYLHSSYRPDLDYVDGVLQERNVGEKDHAWLHTMLAFRFNLRKETWKITAFVELRTQVSLDRFRVPDILVLADDAPDEQIITHPPLIVIEILSPEDTIYRMGERIGDYLSFGVPNIWVIDPKSRCGYVCESANFTHWREQPVLGVSGTDITIDVDELFREMK